MNSIFALTTLLAVFFLTSCASTSSVPAGAAPSRTAPAAPAASAAAASKKEALAYWQGRKDLISAPPAAKAETLKLPAHKHFTLPNGLHVLLMADRRLPLIDVQMAVRVGTIDEPAGKAGLAHFAMRMLRQGTKRWSADEISERLDAAGAELVVNVGYEASTLVCSGRREKSELCLETLGEMVIRPSFPEGEMDEVRDKLLGTAKAVYDNPSLLVRQHFNNQLYGDGHPAGRPLSAETVQSIVRDDLVDFHRRQVVPAAGYLGISGDFQPAQMERLVRRYFQPWSKAPVPRRQIAPVKDPPSLRVLIVDKPDLTQSFFVVGHAGIKRHDPARVPLLVFNYILGGGGFSSRLMKVVRSDGGKTYGIYSRFEMAEDDGSFAVGSFTRNDQLLSTLQLVRGELQRITSATPPTASELRLAQGDMAGGYAISLMTSSRIVGELLRAELFGLPESFVTDYALQVDAVKLEQLPDIAKSRLRPEKLVVVVVGRAETVAPQFQKVGWPFTVVPYLSPISAEQRAAK